MLKLEKRNINLDVIRCIAVFSVISVHFFNNTEFYQQIVSGKRMYCMVIIFDINWFFDVEERIK